MPHTAPGMEGHTTHLIVIIAAVSDLELGRNWKSNVSSAAEVFPAQAGPEGMKKINSITWKYFHFLFVENLQQILTSRAVGQTAFNLSLSSTKEISRIPYSRSNIYVCSAPS